MEWISVDQKKPESGVHVLLCCQTASGGRYVCDGYFAERWTVEVPAYNYGDCACEYNEEDDAYYLEEGWYEVIKNWDDYSSVFIQDTVTHWTEMLELPKEDA